MISEYIEKDKLPQAVGLNMVAKALVTMTIGQSLGKKNISAGTVSMILKFNIFALFCEKEQFQILNFNPSTVLTRNVFLKVLHITAIFIISLEPRELDCAC